MNSTVLRLPQVKAFTGLARSTIYAAIASGQFPKPIKIGPRAIGFLQAEVENWLADRVAQRDQRLAA